VAPLIGRAITGLALAVAIGLAIPHPGAGQEATSQPTATRIPTCSERFPAEGPAGVDLRLGCIVSELVGLYTASSRDEPPRLSAYALMLAGLLAFGSLLVALVVRLLARRAAARLAPVIPTAWWVCPSCNSVNATSASRCYACGGPPGAGPPMTTDPSPGAPRSPGSSARA